jgi:chromosome segregation ATPase
MKDSEPSADNSNKDVFSDMLQRLQALGERLKSKEAEVETLNSKCTALQSQLQIATNDASSARKELQQEGLRAELLQQKCAQQELELQTQTQMISSIKSEHMALDNTLALAQVQLSTVTSNLEEKTRELVS